jgi:alkylmercury lyase-like protein
VDLDLETKLAIYGHFAETGTRPAPEEIARRVAVPVSAVIESYARLRAQRVLVLEEDGSSIRMAPPFSGVPTQHIVEVSDRSYFANCAWDAFGIPAALRREGTVRSRCEQSKEPLRLVVGPAGVDDSGWLFHCAVPAAHWWDDIVFT